MQLWSLNFLALLLKSAVFFSASISSSFATLGDSMTSHQFSIPCPDMNQTWALSAILDRSQRVFALAFFVSSQPLHLRLSRLKLCGYDPLHNIRFTRYALASGLSQLRHLSEYTRSLWLQPNLILTTIRSITLPRYRDPGTVVHT